MRRFLCLATLVIVVFSWCSVALAASARNQVTFKLNGELSFDEPLSRWLEELCDMATVTTGFYWGESGKYLEARLDMGDKNALEVKLVRKSGNVLIDCNLLDSPVIVTGVCDWADDMLLYAAFGLKTPSSGNVTPVSAEKLALALKSFSSNLRAISAVARGSVCRPCENCNVCENCKICDVSKALAMFTDALAVRLDEAPEHNALIISCAPRIGEFEPFTIEASRQADDGLAVNLVKRAIEAVCQAVASNA